MPSEPLLSFGRGRICEGTCQGQGQDFTGLLILSDLYSSTPPVFLSDENIPDLAAELVQLGFISEVRVTPACVLGASLPSLSALPY